MRKIHRLELSGQKFGNWLVLEKGDLGPRGEIYWSCRCDCGVIRDCRASLLRSGQTTNCGCQRGTHRMTKTKTYKSWDSMRQRCNNPNSPDYSRYGGKGIKVCERWQASFENFLSDVGERPEGKSLDRIDNSRGYEPSNCRWATASEQQLNKASNWNFLYHGKTRSIVQLSNASGVPIKVLRWRLEHFWEINRAVETPLRTKRKT